MIWGVYLSRLWQGQRQVDLRSIHLLAAIEKYDWKAMGEFVGADYRDEWKDDRVLLLERLRGVFPALPNARIESNMVFVKAKKGGGSWIARITVKSTGEFADYFPNR